MVERFRPLCVVLPSYCPLCFFRPLVPQNRPQGGDSPHVENHWSNSLHDSLQTYIATVGRCFSLRM